MAKSEEIKTIMTTAQVEQFLAKVEQDEALQQELAGALQAEDDRQAVTNLAQTKGYEFTPDELWAEVQKRQAEAQNQQDSGELSDEDLEAVAGGNIGMINLGKWVGDNIVDKYVKW